MTHEQFASELKRDTEALLKLLNDPQPGLYTWNEQMLSALIRVHGYIGCEKCGDVHRELLTDPTASPH